MRKLPLTILVLAIGLAANAAPARADFGLGLFVGDPTGLDLKIGLSNRSGLDVVLGVDTFRDGRVDYGHLTYLVTPLVAHGDSVLVPIRFGIGGAVYGSSDNLDLGVRAPFELALRMRSAPLEIYGEIALLFTLTDPNLDVQGGIGLRLFL